MIYDVPPQPPAIIYQSQIPTFLSAQDWVFINSLNIKVRRACIALINECKKQGITIQITEGARSLERQQQLYDIGRDEYGKVINQSKILTNARPGYSYHNYGLAFDFCINMPGYSKYDSRLIESVGWIGKIKIGLEWGGDFKTFKDTTHFQWSNGLTLTQLRQGLRP